MDRKEKSLMMRMYWRRFVLVMMGVCAAWSVQAQVVTNEEKEEEEEEGVQTELTDTLSVDSLLTGVEPVLPWPQYMTSRLDTIIRKSSFMKNATLGMMVYDATADSLLFKYNETKLMRPASTEKLLTTITALHRLGADYPFKTRLYHTGEIRTDTIDLCRVDSVTMLPMYALRRVLHGDVYGVGAFDPMFTGSDLNAFADRLKSLDIDSIAGNLYEDVSLKDTIRWGKGWCWDDQDSNPTLSPLLVDRRDVFMRNFREALHRRNILFGGAIGTAVCPADAVLVAEKIRTLSQVMQRLMKKSDNLYAEAVFYQLGALSGRRGVVAGDSESVINQLIRQLGYDPGAYRIVDGSGLSHYNNISAELELAFLKFARENEPIYNALYPTLPIAGVDGTLKSRMHDMPTFRNVHAKTGTLNGVITLSGYATSATNHELIFVILLNGVRSSSAARGFEDDLCTILTHDETPIVEKKRVVVAKKATVRRRAAKHTKRRRVTTRRRR